MADGFSSVDRYIEYEVEPEYSDIDVPIDIYDDYGIYLDEDV